jgi:hypothetical protein
MIYFVKVGFMHFNLSLVKLADVAINIFKPDMEGFMARKTR